MAYSSTPLSTTGKSPAELLLRRPMKTKMPKLSYMEEEVKDGDPSGQKPRCAKETDKQGLC